MTTKLRFTLGGLAECVAGIDDEAYTENPLLACHAIRKYGKHTTQYEGTREEILAVLDSIEGCPAYSPPGDGGGSEGFGGDYCEVQAVRRASDSLRKTLGLELLGWRRTVRRRRRTRK